MKWIVAFSVCLMIAVSPALGAVTSMGKGPSFAQLKSACDAAGGEFVDQTEHDLGYSCHVPNCDGKGGECKIDCGTSGCTATTPIRLSGAQTLVGILQNGSNVVRAKPAAGQSLGDPAIGLRPPEEKEALPNGCSLC